MVQRVGLVAPDASLYPASHSNVHLCFDSTPPPGQSAPAVVPLALTLMAAHCSSTHCGWTGHWPSMPQLMGLTASAASSKPATQLKPHVGELSTAPPSQASEPAVVLLGAMEMGKHCVSWQHVLLSSATVQTAQAQLAVAAVGLDS